MTTVVGIGYPYHDCGAAVLVDGEIVAAVNESRLSRIKREARFPSSAVNELLEDVESVDRIALAGVENAPLGRTLRTELKRTDNSVDRLAEGLRAVQSGLAKTPAIVRETAEKLAAETSLSGAVQELVENIEYVDHHRAHAASAYYTSGFADATVLTIDSSGDGLSSAVWTGSDGTLEQVATNDSVDSIGRIWNQVPTVFGFKGFRHAGKFMGLASYCDDVPPGLGATFDELLTVDGLSVKNRFRRAHANDSYEERVLAWKDLVGDYSAPAVASALQRRTEEVVTEFAETAVETTGCANLALAGGVTANVKLNQRLYELDRVDRLFVHQNMGDGGLAVGAALDHWARSESPVDPTLLDDVYLGPSYDEASIQRAIEAAELPEGYRVRRFDSDDELAAFAAGLLADGHVVNLFRGRMEYGPRALGNRSILYQPTDPSAITWLNERLERTAFMPFAPVTLAEEADECYENYDPDACPAAMFMTITFDCTETMQKRSPGAVHLDGTARPQILEERMNPFYYAVVDEYRRQTGVPTLLNTSFNVHGEPIVCTPGDALRSFLDFGTKALVIGTTAVVAPEES
ncbi:carbamoyltransferase C-terminal domain-containing protein [Halobellus ordinarius]|uniref:carbamoyltransferase C-terminal domain-containing protein n=1 Tax=Halobellus ordinarius TaxID=3075120 RepID=UPI0028808EFA|nr:carbamoyltransferase C-terminal domain-containing protein [Halobellus sp. ZY16]